MSNVNVLGYTVSISKCSCCKIAYVHLSYMTQSNVIANGQQVFSVVLSIAIKFIKQWRVVKSH